MHPPAPDGDDPLPDPSDYGERIAEVYDQWYAGDPGQVRPAVDFLAGHAGDGPVLELGVGTGRIAVPLASRGLAVSGIDVSPQMIAKLREKVGGDRVKVSIGDFADVDADGGPFRLVYVVFSTFFGLLTQAEQVRCFRNVAANLIPGGVFVIEAFVPDLARFDRGQRLQVDDLRGETGLISASVHDRAAQRIHSRHYAISDGGISSYPVEIRYAWPSELDLMAQIAGLDPLARWAGWQDQPFTSTSGMHVSAWTAPARQRAAQTHRGATLRINRRQSPSSPS
jgi:SAM-dependent methyltransferase